MSITVLDEQFDKVIKSQYITAKTDYAFVLEHLVQLIDRLDEQRYTLRPQFYAKLEKDIINGCIMPPLTLAINKKYDSSDSQEYVNNNIKEAFILDGIQRLNTI